MMGVERLMRGETHLLNDKVLEDQPSSDVI